MNTTFKLGKVSIPVDVEAGVNIEIEGLEISLENLNLKEYVSALKELPGIIKNIRLAVEEDVEDMMDDEEEFEPFGMSGGFESFIEELAKANKVAHFPKAQPKVDPLEALFGKPQPLNELLKDVAEIKGTAPKHPFEAFLDKKAEEFKPDMPESLKKLLASQGIDVNKVKVINGSLQDMMGLFDKGPKF